MNNIIHNKNVISDIDCIVDGGIDIKDTSENMINLVNDAIVNIDLCHINSFKATRFLRILHTHYKIITINKGGDNEDSIYKFIPKEDRESAAIAYILNITLSRAISTHKVYVREVYKSDIKSTLRDVIINYIDKTLNISLSTICTEEISNINAIGSIENNLPKISTTKKIYIMRKTKSFPFN